MGGAFIEFHLSLELLHRNSIPTSLVGILQTIFHLVSTLFGEEASKVRFLALSPPSSLLHALLSILLKLLIQMYFALALIEFSTMTTTMVQAHIDALSSESHGVSPDGLSPFCVYV